jgi:hypothetical protein
MQRFVSFAAFMGLLSFRPVVVSSLWGSSVGDIVDSDLCVSVYGPPGWKRLGRALCEFFPMFLLSCALLVWAPGIFVQSPRMYTYLSGVLMFHATAQVILFTMAWQDLPCIDRSLVPYFLLILASWLIPPSWRVQFHSGVMAYGVVVCFYAFWWLLSVLWQMREKLGVHILSVGKLGDEYDDITTEESSASEE